MYRDQIEHYFQHVCRLSRLQEPFAAALGARSWGDNDIAFLFDDALPTTRGAGEFEIGF